MAETTLSTTSLSIVVWSNWCWWSDLILPSLGR